MASTTSHPSTEYPGYETWMGDRWWYLLDRNQHLAIGSYLVASGLIVGLVNLLGIGTLVRYKVFWEASLIPELGLFLSDLCVGGLHPFSGSSALVNYWLWGPVGCQLYSMAGFLFGHFQLLSIAFIAFDRYVLVCKPSWGTKIRNPRSYLKIFVGMFLLALFSAVVPLVGWGRYDLMATGVSCTIDFQVAETSFSSYSTAIFIVFVVIPVLLAVVWSRLLAKKVNTMMSGSRPLWLPKKNLGLVLCGCVLVTPVAFGAYGAVVIWAIVAGGSEGIPVGLVALPPLQAKMAGLFNPLFYIYANPLLWNYYKKFLGLKADNALIKRANRERETGGRLGEDEQVETAMVESPTVLTN